MRLALALGVAALCFVLDQGSKWLVLEVMELRERGFFEVGPILNFVLVYNKGVNFGLFASGGQTQQIVLAAFAAIVSVGLLIWAARSTKILIALGAGLVVGGALANALDRLVEGAVVDFINFDCCGIGNPYAFNIADTSIFLGAVMLAWFAWDDTPEKQAPGSSDKPAQ